MKFRHLFCTVCFLFLIFYGQAQINLVKNPGFEQYSNCPNFPQQIYYADFWNGLNNNPNDTDLCNGTYFNVCANPIVGDYFGVPGFGVNLNYQYPHSGNAYVGLTFFRNIGYVRREYAQSILSQTLTLGKVYCFKMWINLSNESKYALDNIQAYIDNGNIDTAKCGYPIAITPQIQNTAGNVITDTLNWVLIKGSFTANGVENTVTIGNFYTDALTQINIFNSGAHNPNNAYYLLDDISLIPSDLPAFAGPDTSVCKNDSIYIGRPPEIGLDNIWTELHTGTQVGVGAGIWLKPDTTATYVVTQDLCGTITHDTIKVVVNCIGIEKYFNNPQINIYPNPNNGYFSITTTYHSSNMLVEIYNSLGEVVQRKSVQDKTVSVSGLDEGMYFVKVIEEGKLLSTQKVIVVK